MNHTAAFQLIGYDNPLGIYPAPVVPIGRIDNRTVVVYYFGDSFSLIDIPEHATFIEKANIASSFDPLRHRLFARTRNDVICYTASEEASIMLSLLSSPDLAKDSPFLRLSMARISASPESFCLELGLALASADKQNPAFARRIFRTELPVLNEMLRSANITVAIPVQRKDFTATYTTIGKEIRIARSKTASTESGSETETGRPETVRNQRNGLIERAKAARPRDQFETQLKRIRENHKQIDCIAEAVNSTVERVTAEEPASLVIYGDPQSGKTEMMICLTARLLDEGYKTIVHLTNDSVDLLRQSMKRFRDAGLAPSPRSASEVARHAIVEGHSVVVFCKKNKKELTGLLGSTNNHRPILVIDDEADYASPNSKINQAKKSEINKIIDDLIGDDGHYIGVTATPARLDLNNTFNTAPETWVHFRSHYDYTGPDCFFPLALEPDSPNVPYRLKLLSGPGSEADARIAFARFMVTVAALNTRSIAANRNESNFTFLIHTSGKMDDHRADRAAIQEVLDSLVSREGTPFEDFCAVLEREAETLYPADGAHEIVEYIVKNSSRYAFVVLNSERDRREAGDEPTKPSCPFTIIIGGNIVSRGVTFPNLLSMYFTRSPKTKIQQDTYIQRARMFGARGSLLSHFELTIPSDLFWDWHRCFVFHRLALQTIRRDRVSPVWLGDPRVSVVASSSIDRGTVVLDKSEMSFQMFRWSNFSEIDAVISRSQTSIATLHDLRRLLGEVLPQYLVEYISSEIDLRKHGLAIHKCGHIKGYKNEEEVRTIARSKGFLGKSQLEQHIFPKATHHIKILHNGQGFARVFYKNLVKVTFSERNPERRAKQTRRISESRD